MYPRRPNCFALYQTKLYAFRRVQNGGDDGSDNGDADPIANRRIIVWFVPELFHFSASSQTCRHVNRVIKPTLCAVCAYVCSDPLLKMVDAVRCTTNSYLVKCFNCVSFQFYIWIKWFSWHVAGFCVCVCEHELNFQNEGFRFVCFGRFVEHWQKKRRETTAARIAQSPG